MSTLCTKCKCTVAKQWTRCGVCGQRRNQLTNPPELERLLAFLQRGKYVLSESANLVMFVALKDAGMLDAYIKRNQS